MIYDVAVIGGGASGLMAAGRAAELGASVIVLEKNKMAGVKLLMTGGMRCNLTNLITDYKTLASKYGPAGRFLVSALARFGSSDTVDFFEGHGVKTKIENNNRVFPVTDNARSVLKALMDYNQTGGVEIRLEAAVKDIMTESGHITEVVLMSGQRVQAKKYIIATGGKSYPGSGSTGDANAWLEKMGHRIMPLSPGLVAILLNDKYISELEGLSRTDVSLELMAGGKTIASSYGDILFTASGLSGPAAFNLSRSISAPAAPDLQIIADFFPDFEVEEFDGRLAELFAGNVKTIKNCLGEILPPKLIPVLEKLAGFDFERRGNSVTKTERLKIGALLKGWRLDVQGLDSYDRAMITVGGLDLKEVDPKTMRSKLIDNLFVVGEALDIAGPSGGFNLQVCWSTGRIAGEAAA